MNPIITIENVREEKHRYESTIELLRKFDENTLPTTVRAPFMKNRNSAIKNLEKQIRILDKIARLIEAGEIVMSP